MPGVVGAFVTILHGTVQHQPFNREERENTEILVMSRILRKILERESTSGAPRL